MKVLNIAVAVALMLACVRFTESSALPFSEVQMGEIENRDGPVMGQEETAVDLSMPLRVKRHQSHLSLCRWCCNCCRGYKGCGFCCH